MIPLCRLQRHLPLQGRLISRTNIYNSIANLLSLTGRDAEHSEAERVICFV